MSPNADNEDEDAARQERTIRSLTERAGGAPIEHVRGLFMGELSRLGRGAKVRRYLHMLTTSNVREMLRSSGRVRE